MVHSHVRHMDATVTNEWLLRADKVDIIHLYNTRVNRLCTRDRVCHGKDNGKCDNCFHLHHAFVSKYHLIRAHPKDMTVELAQKEIAFRLVYECMFGIVSPYEISNGTWLNRSLRDYGHTKRLFLLCKRVQHVPMKYRWITLPRY